MANVKDLFTPATASVQQPPSGVNVTEAQNKTPSANVLNVAEAKKQIELRTVTEEAATKEIEVKKEIAPKRELVVKKSSETDTHYTYSIEHGKHRLEIRPEKGLTYNYHAVCSCQWEGRFLTSDLAETAAKTHVSRIG